MNFIETDELHYVIVTSISHYKFPLTLKTKKEILNRLDDHISFLVETENRPSNSNWIELIMSHVNNLAIMFRYSLLLAKID